MKAPTDGAAVLRTGSDGVCIPLTSVDGPDLACADGAKDFGRLRPARGEKICSGTKIGGKTNVIDFQVFERTGSPAFVD